MNDDPTFRLLTISGTILAVVTSIFWMIVGWRAMRAHERIADKIAGTVGDKRE